MGLIRFILAAAIVIGHLGYTYLLNGMVAVQSFFILSGFYMALVINEKYNFEGGIKFFYHNRILRIFPIYFSVLILTLLFTLVFHSLGYTQNNLSNWSSLQWDTKLYAIFSNIFIVGQDLYLHLGIDENGGLIWMKYYNNSPVKLYEFILIPQAWTISLELMFYAIAPFLIHNNIKIFYLIIIMFLTLLMRIVIYRMGYYFAPWTYRFFPTELFLFLLGACAYRWHKTKYLVFEKRKWQVVAFALMVIIIIVYNQIPLANSQKQPVYYLIFAGLLPFVFNLSKNLKFDFSIGELSYPIYISHIFVIVFFLKWIALPFRDGGILALFAVIGFSWILNKFIAKPMTQFKKQDRKSER